MMGIKPRAFTVAIAVTLACGPALPAPAQDPVPPPPPLPTTLQSAPIPQPEPRSEEESSPATPPEPTIPYGRSLALQLMNEELTRLQAAKSAQLDELTNAVENLQTVLKARRQTTAQSQQSTSPSTSQPRTTPSSPKQLTGPEPPTAAPPLSAAPTPSPEQDATSDNLPSLEPTTQAPSDNLFPPAETSIVDAISLADNLFAAGDTEGALGKYQALTKELLPVSHKRWVIYQVACCHRRLGNIPAAEVIYRELAAVADKTTVPTQARWWLDAIQRRKQAEERLNRVRFTIASMEQEQRDEQSP